MPGEHTTTATPGFRWFGLVAFVGHLLLLGTDATALWRIAGEGKVGILVAALFVVAYLGIWLVWLAPGSQRRLRAHERMLLLLTMVPALAVVAALGRLWMLGLVAGSFILLGDALDHRRR